jgi:glycerophosphoryl diester phosphodiesterase
LNSGQGAAHVCDCGSGTGQIGFTAVLNTEGLKMLELVAHRGASHDAPENTVAAFEAAREQGADAVECDLRLTADNAVVAMHDATTGRTSDRDLAVAETGLTVLQRLDAGSWKGRAWAGERVPTLAQILAFGGRSGLRLLLEIKVGPALLAPLAAALRAAGASPAQVELLSFSTDVLRAAKEELPQFRRRWLCDFRREPAGSQTWQPGLETIIPVLSDTGATGLGCNARDPLAAHFIASLHRAGYECHAWTVDDAATAAQLRNSGIDSITTNRPGWLRQQLLRQPRS